MTARSQAGSTRGLYLAAQGGHNAESHNHNDVGNFMVYHDGSPVLIDVGVETYTAKTFSGRRYDIWTMQSAYHNLPTINGVMQKDGREFAAKDVRYRADDRIAELAMDIAPAYPKEAGVKSWNRTLRLERGKRVVVRDRFELEKAEAPPTWSFMTVRRPVKAGPGRIALENAEGVRTSSALSLIYDGQRLDAVIEPISLSDGRLRSAWGETICRIILKAKAAIPRGDFIFRIE